MIEHVTTIMLGEGRSAHVVIDGLTVSVTHTVDADGNPAMQLGGVDCNLAGELPGLYYLEPLSDPTQAVPDGTTGSTGEDPYRSVEQERWRDHDDPGRR